MTQPLRTEKGPVYFIKLKDVQDRALIILIKRIIKNQLIMQFNLSQESQEIFKKTYLNKWKRLVKNLISKEPLFLEIESNH